MSANEANEESRSAEEERNSWVKISMKSKLPVFNLFFYGILQCTSIL